MKVLVTGGSGYLGEATIGALRRHGHQVVALARSDAAGYAGLRDLYRDMARTLGFEGHIAWAEAMP